MSCGCNNNSNGSPFGYSPYGSTCAPELPYPQVSAESVPSLISNLTYSLYGQISKYVANGKIKWNIPCDPNNTAQINGFPRNAGEGILCYILRAFQNLPSLVSNLPVTATGSTTPRYLSDRFADNVNVKDWGAKGDGVTDDQPAIQQAINYAIANNKNSLYFPSGVYNLVTIFSGVPTGLRLSGISYQPHLVAATATSSTAVGGAVVENQLVTKINVLWGGAGYGNSPIVTIVGGGPSTPATATAIVVNGIITGFTITNNGARYTSVPSVVISAPTGINNFVDKSLSFLGDNAIIQSSAGGTNNSFISGVNTAMLYISNLSNYVIDGLTFKTLGINTYNASTLSYGLTIAQGPVGDGSLNPPPLPLVNGVYSGTPTLMQSVRGIEVTNCFFLNNSCSIGINGFSTLSQENTLSNWAVEDVRITNNAFLQPNGWNGGQCLIQIPTTDVRYVNISNNYYDGCYNSNTSIRAQDGFCILASSNNIVSNNIIKNFGYETIYIRAQYNAWGDGREIADTSFSAQQNYETDLVTGNYLSNNASSFGFPLGGQGFGGSGGYGITIENPNAVVSNNNIKNCLRPIQVYSNYLLGTLSFTMPSSIDGSTIPATISFATNNSISQSFRFLVGKQYCVSIGGHSAYFTLVTLSGNSAGIRIDSMGKGLQYIPEAGNVVSGEVKRSLTATTNVTIENNSIWFPPAETNPFGFSGRKLSDIAGQFLDFNSGENYRFVNNRIFIPDFNAFDLSGFATFTSFSIVNFGSNCSGEVQGNEIICDARSRNTNLFVVGISGYNCDRLNVRNNSFRNLDLSIRFGATNGNAVTFFEGNSEENCVKNGLVSQQATIIENPTNPIGRKQFYQFTPTQIGWHRIAPIAGRIEGTMEIWSDNSYGQDWNNGIAKNSLVSRIKLNLYRREEPFLSAITDSEDGSIVVANAMQTNGGVVSALRISAALSTDVSQNTWLDLYVNSATKAKPVFITFNVADGSAPLDFYTAKAVIPNLYTTYLTGFYPTDNRSFVLKGQPAITYENSLVAGQQYVIIAQGGVNWSLVGATADPTGSYGGIFFTATGIAKSVALNNGGSGWTSTPTAVIGTPWTSGATATYGQQYYYGNNLYTITLEGNTGVTPPTHTSGFVTANVTGSPLPAAAIFKYAGTIGTCSVTIVSNVITGISVATAGTGYTSTTSPVTFVGGGGGGAQATITIGSALSTTNGYCALWSSAQIVMGSNLSGVSTSILYPLGT